MRITRELIEKYRLPGYVEGFYVDIYYERKSNSNTVVVDAKTKEVIGLPPVDKKNVVVFNADNWPRTAEGKRGKLKHAIKTGNTFAILSKPEYGGVLETAMAKLHRGDKFDPKVGRIKAFGKLMGKIQRLTETETEG
jgi:hypothetical protein